MRITWEAMRAKSSKASTSYDIAGNGSTTNESTLTTVPSGRINYVWIETIDFNLITLLNLIEY